MKKLIYLAADCDERLAKYFEGAGFDVRLIHTTGFVAAPVSNHPDMFMCKLGVRDDDEIVNYWDQPSTEWDAAAGSPQGDDHNGAAQGSVVLREQYPFDIAYNAACTGRFFIHNLDYTAPHLFDRAYELGMQMVDVKQGYAKCSTLVVDERSIITYDRGLGSACAKAGMDVLMVSPGHITLPGYDTGFIGGTSGRVGDTVYFNGDLTAHPDHEKIIDFIQARRLKVKWFPDWPLTDIGSIICETKYK